MEPALLRVEIETRHETDMRRGKSHSLTLFAERSGQRWIVLDADGNFWELPEGDDPWQRRQPFYPTDDIDLDMVPGHYKQLLGLPN